MAIALQDATFKQLRDFIYERCGIFVPDVKKYLIENRLAKRIQERNLSSFEDYLYLIRYNSSGDEMTKLFDAVTTNETFFFREPQQFDVLTESIIPELMKKKGGRPIQIWSAACSTGEEPYTIAMLAAEKRFPARFDIVGSDISEAVLATAKKGVYGSYAVRNIPPAYMSKYIRQNGQSYELDSSIRNAVRFVNINFMDDKKMRTLRDMDIIFCRNVLIYFDDKAKQKVVAMLYDSLKPGGSLLIGSSESLHNVTRAFKPVIINKVVVYQRS